MKDLRSIQPVVYLLGLAGVGLFIVLLLREGAGQVAAAIAHVGWGLLALTIYHLVQTLSDSAGWLVLIPKGEQSGVDPKFSPALDGGVGK